MLDHHHRAVDHEADRYREPAERHQVRRQAVAVHHDEGEERRQHQRRDDDQARAHVAEEQEQHHDHQDHALDQHLRDRPERLVDELGAVVVGHDPQPARQHAAVVDLLHARLDAAHHLLRVARPDHHDDPAGRLGVAVLDHGADAHLLAEGDLGDVADVDRRRADLLQHDRADVLEVADQADAAHEKRLRPLPQDAAAGVRVVAGERLVDVVDRDAVIAQAVRVDEHLVLLDVAAGRVDLGDAGDRAEQRPHHPVLYRAPLEQLVLGQRALAVVGPLERVLVDLAERRRHRPEHRRHPLRQVGADLEQPLHDQLAREVDVGRVGEDERDQRQAGLVERAELGQAGQAGHRDLERHGDEALDLLRRAARCLGRDLHLDVGDVGERVDRKLARRLQPEREQGERDHDDDEALPERSADEPVEQAFSSRSAARAGGARC